MSKKPIDYEVALIALLVTIAIPLAFLAISVVLLMFFNALKGHEYALSIVLGMIVFCAIWFCVYKDIKKAGGVE